MSEHKVGKLTEIDLEILQQKRLLDAFLRIETYDGREAVIAACEKLISSRLKD